MGRISRVKAGEPIVQQLLTVGVVLSGLGRASLAARCTMAWLGVMANAIRHHRGQHTAQHPGRGGVTDGTRGALRCRRVGQHTIGPGDALHKARCPIHPAVGNSVHHGGDLQRRHGQRPLPKAERRQLAGVFQRLRVRQRTGSCGQARGNLYRCAKAEVFCLVPDGLCPQQLAQFDKIGVAAFFQRTAQVDFAVGAALGAAVGLPRHHDFTGAVVGEPVQALFIGSCGQHHFKHRPSAERSKRAVDERSIVGADAGGHILCVKRRRTDAGKHLACSSVHNEDAPPRHKLRRQRLTGALQVGVQCQLHALPSAFFPRSPYRACPRHQAAVRRQHAADGALIAGGRQQRVVGAFQPGDAAAFAVEVAQQMRCNIHRMRRHRAGGDAPPGQVAADFNQERRGQVTAVVKHALLFVGNIGKQRRVAIVAGDAERVILRLRASQFAAVAVVEIAPGPR